MQRWRWVRYLPLPVAVSAPSLPRDLSGTHNPRQAAGSETDNIGSWRVVRAQAWIATTKSVTERPEYGEASAATESRVHALAPALPKVVNDTKPMNYAICLRTMAEVVADTE